MNEFLINVVSSFTNNKLEKEHKAFPCSLLVNQRSCQGCSPLCVCLCECVAVDGQSWVCRCLHELLWSSVPHTHAHTHTHHPPFPASFHGLCFSFLSLFVSCSLSLPPSLPLFSPRYSATATERQQRRLAHNYAWSFTAN